MSNLCSHLSHQPPIFPALERKFYQMQTRVSLKLVPGVLFDIEVMQFKVFWNGHGCFGCAGWHKQDYAHFTLLEELWF